MTSFITAMDNINNMKVGVNGSDVYTKPIGKHQELLALFGTLNRDLEHDRLCVLLNDAIKTSTLEDLAVLTFHTRDILEGKGERDLFYTMFHELYEKSPSEMLKTMKEIPNYGGWFDFQKLISHGVEHDYLPKPRTESDSQMKKTLRAELIVKEAVKLYSNKIIEDSTKEHDLSLAAKWVPREGKRNGWLGELVAENMYPNLTDSSKLKEARKTISAINTRLDTVEQKMCHDKESKHHFADIEPSHVPSRCLKMKRKAFLNENKDGYIRDEYDMDRMMCRNRFLEHVNKAIRGESSVHGRRLMPHEFIVALERNSTQTDRDTLQAQWNDLRQSVLDKGTLGKTVVMCDFSGSMEGMPMNVSKGLGLLCSECTHPAFRDRMLTFDSNPTWHNVSKYNSLYERIQSFQGVSQGTSTNFQAAVNLILNQLIDAKVPVGEEPDVLLVLTDMGWDQANNDNNKFETHIDRIKKQFASAGKWNVPTIVIWNISGKFQEYHHEAETPGTCTISGWSSTILKYIMSGENIKEKLKTLTPLSMMREVLNDERYDAIRKIIRGY